MILSIITRNNFLLIRQYSKLSIEPVIKPPKKPLNAYVRFIKENEPNLKEHNINPQDKIKMLATKWNTLETSQKSKYQEDYQRELDNYHLSYESYLKNLTDDQKDAIRNTVEIKKQLKLKLKELGYPKLPRTSYMLFVTEHKEECKGKYPATFIREIAARWQTLSSDEKQTYNNKAKEDKTRYSAELKKWELQMEIEGYTDILQQLKTKSKKSKT